MTKKILPLFTIITLAACLLSYKLGSAPVALAEPGAAAQEMAAQDSPATLPTAPATWTAFFPFNGGGVPTATRAAGGAGVKHVATCISVHLTDNRSNFILFPVALRDGLSGTGTPLAEWNLGMTATNGTGSQIDLCDLNIVGSANTSMTLEFNPINWPIPSRAAGSVVLVGYDAQ
jgi:hypothetical protein